MRRIEWAPGALSGASYIDKAVTIGHNGAIRALHRRL
jgi:hypothetical protein